ncbi:Imm40 family immunity protein [Caulobacter sp. 17J65-9]|uniref:Imm40 family immunity protein n=1 Tax=Caulobacter sp. 17J65-9 TaxID=2709382 RepID=UPI0013C750D8|nr:Imm40 family immunity protein [Caulobacter sp. 17J65-9]NEX94032.1 hypothetical protein [Caulobacter sp. 17J65-9]
MKTTWGSEVEAVLNSGVSLEPFGVQGWALPQVDALAAIERLRGLGVPVVGGDAFERKSGELVLAYANWCCELFPGEEIASYVDRSALVARRFVSEYRGRDPYFAIVPRT